MTRVIRLKNTEKPIRIKLDYITLNSYFNRIATIIKALTPNIYTNNLGKI